MIIGTLPTAAAVRIESRLQPEEVNLTYAGEAALEADISARITKYNAVVGKKLAAVVTSADNQTIATEALMLRVLASLYGTAGYLNTAYWERAQELKAESADLIDDLTGTSADNVALVSNGAGTLSTARYGLNLVGLPVVNGSYYA